MTSHIQLMEPELAQRATIPFAALTAASTAAASASDASTAAPSSGAEALRRTLDEFGFAIVTGVVDEETLQKLEGLWAEDLRSIVDVAGSNPDVLSRVLADPVHNWPSDTAPLGRSFASDYGLPQGRLAWAVRTSPQVRKVFASIFGTEELCAGCDNIFFQTTPKPTDPDAKRHSSLWPHADQNLHNLPGGSFDCFQGVLYLWPADVDTAATVVWPGSNRSVYMELMNDSKRWKGRGHFCRLGNAEVPHFARAARRVPVPRGGLLLWSSKTIHQGWPIGPRLAVPVCLEPKARRTQAVIDSKKRCILAGVPTTHWASLAVEHSVHSRPSDELVQTSSGLVLKHAAHNHIGRKIPEEIWNAL